MGGLCILLGQSVQQSPPVRANVIKPYSPHGPENGGGRQNISHPPGESHNNIQFTIVIALLKIICTAQSQNQFLFKILCFPAAWCWAGAAGWDPYRALLRRRGRGQDAALLLVRGHR